MPRAPCGQSLYSRDSPSGPWRTHKRHTVDSDNIRNPVPSSDVFVPGIPGQAAPAGCCGGEITEGPMGMTTYEAVQGRVRTRPRTWLVTGVAGFIGSNLLETLLKLDQRVIGLDNFSTGSRSNLTQAQDPVTKSQWRNFRLIAGDTGPIEPCARAGPS